MSIKVVSISLLVLLFISQLTAQTLSTALTDKLNPEKRSELAKFIPMTLVDSRLPATFTLMPADTFIRHIAAFKAAMEKRIVKEKNVSLQQLRREDLTYFISEIRLTYQLRYGLDYSKLPKPDEEITSAVVSIVPLEHSHEERERLAAIVNLPVNLSNRALFKTSAAYRSWLNRYLYARAAKFPIDTALGFGAEKLSLIKAIKANVTDPYMRDQLSYAPYLAAIKSIRNPDVKEAIYQDFMHTVTDKAYQADVTEAFNNFKYTSVDAPAPDFNYMSIDGRNVSLQSLRGKYVYIDLWATWCGPCKIQIPYLAALEETFSTKMHFVSLSIDKAEDKAVWRSYVLANKLGGIQLMADKDTKSDFVKKFNVSGIPRFLLIDPKGRIVDANAKAPSDPKLKAQLADLLNQ